METRATSSLFEVLGEVEVNGTTYRIALSGFNEYAVVRGSDGRSVGRLRGSPSVMWLLEPSDIDDELLRVIAQSAIEQGLLEELPSD